MYTTANPNDNWKIDAALQEQQRLGRKFSTGVHVLGIIAIIAYSFLLGICFSVGIPMLFKKDIWPAGVFLVVMGVYFSVGDFVAGTSLSLRQSAKKSDALKEICMILFFIKYGALKDFYRRNPELAQ